MALVPHSSTEVFFLYATAEEESPRGKVASSPLVTFILLTLIGTNTTFENKYGVYISESKVLAANSTIAPIIKGACPLGRPWNAQHRSIFMDSYFDESVLPEGYIGWGTNFNPNKTL